MDDKDRVFARFKDEKSAATGRRETLTVRKRAGALGSRVVEVVRVRSGGAVRDRPKRQDPYVRAASWDGGFPTKQTSSGSMANEPAGPEVAQPVGHVMPAWGPAAAEAGAASAEEPVAAPRRGRGRPRKHPVGQPVATLPATASAEEPVAEPHRSRGRPRKQPGSPPTRRVADPFDIEDCGANCMRCGYAVEPAREKRGLMTCAECG